jgi:ketosteroid isomerase-like protein
MCRVRACLAMTGVAVALSAHQPSARQESAETLPAQQALPVMTQQLLDALPGKADVWQRYLSDRVVYVSEAGDVATKAELLKGFVPFPDGLAGSIVVRNPRITEFDDVAICVFEAFETQKVYDQQISVTYRSTHTWRREGGNWRLIAAQNVVLAKDPSALPVDMSRWKHFVGTYDLAGKRRYVVEQRGSELFGGREGGDLTRLIPVGENVFVEAGSPLGVQRIFLSSNSERADRMLQRRKFADVTWTRIN